jgi:DNA polymerase I-like protein with 3'-5' exonuclease and polymerase domains
MQNIPAGSEYGKTIKECFVAPLGWIFAGADYSSLEDYISALTTKDPNKLVIYQQGLDSHAFRAISYFGDQMPDISLARGRRVFQINQDGICYNLFEGDTVQLPSGEETTIEEYYETNRIS